MAHIVWHSAGVHEVPDDDAWMDDDERRRLAGMRFPKRRLESRLGRWTAKNAVVRALGLTDGPASLARVTVRNAPDGAPEVALDGADAGLAIAMTDRADWAVCSLLHGRTRVGCDLELVEPRSEAFVADYFTEVEVRWLRGAAPEDRDLYANLAWSAKESALKVLRTGLRRDTRGVEVVLGDDQRAGWRSLEVRAAEGRFPGWWIRYGAFVLTCVAGGATDPPESLVDPPGLSRAVPSHGWMRLLDRPGG